MRKREKSKGSSIVLALLIIAIIVAGAILIATNINKTQSTAELDEQNTVKQDNFTKVESDGTVVNTSQKLNKDKEIDGFLISNIEFKEKDGMTELVADVTNNSGKNKAAFLADIVLYDSNNKEIARIPASVVDTKAGETILIRAKITENYANAYDFKLEKR